MSSGAFLRQSHVARVGNVVSASSEAGLTTGRAVAGTSNTGALQLKSAGTPLTDHALDLRLQRGGLPAGVKLDSADSAVPTPGASLLWRIDGDSSTQWRGWRSPGHLQYARTIVAASVATDYPSVSEPRELANGSIGFLRMNDSAAGTDTVTFMHKSSRTGTWTSVATGATDVDSTSKPALVVWPSGRLVAYIKNTSAYIDAYTSTDNGATWSSYATKCLTASNDGLSAEVVGDYVCILSAGTPATVSTSVFVYWSVDGGQTFTLSDSMAGTMGRMCLDATGRVILAVSSSTTVNFYPVGVAGTIGDALGATMTCHATAPTFNVVAMDDGAIIGMSETSATSGMATQISAKISADNGLNFFGLRGVDTFSVIFDNQTAAGAGTPYGFADYVLGTWQGNLVMITVSNGPTAGNDNSVNELWFGGWDSLVEPVVNSATSDLLNSDFAAKGVYIAHDDPNALGEWAQTNTGAGLTGTLGNNGWNMVASAAGNSYYTAATTIWNPSAGDAVRIKVVFRINSGSSVASDVATIGVSCSDGGNRQWLTIRLGTGLIRAVDNSGTLASSPTVANKFTAWSELFIIFAHDNPSAGGGTASVYYRVASDTHWSTLLENQAIAELGGSPTNYIRFGGDSLVDADWDIAMIAVYDGAGSMHDGFTNPTDLPGRGLSASVPFYVYQGTKIAAYGAPGFTGDTYDYSAAHHYEAENVWRSSRPSQHWRSAADNASTNLVFGGTSNKIRTNMFALFNTNVPSVTIEMNDTNSWATPSFSTTASAVIWQGTATDGDPGYVKVDGQPFIPHRFRSRPGRRYWVECGTPAGTIYEITDNDENRIFVTNMPDSHATDPLRIFGDKMAVLVPDTTYLYVRVVIGAMNTNDNDYRLGSLYVGTRHDITVPYDTGYVDTWRPNIEVYETTAGYTGSAVLGPEPHEIRIAWSPIDRLSTDYMDRVVHLFRALQGEHEPVVFWRDTSDVTTLGLYRVQGPPTRENVYGEGWDDFSRLAQLVLREILP